MADHPTSRPRPRFPAAEVELSVALATYEGARWLGPLLESIGRQGLVPDELVVQDDRSTDDTVAIVEQFAASAPFDVRLEVNDRRTGSTENFERALQRCRGRFVALADQDDVWYPEKLQLLVAELHTDPTVTMVFSDADLIGEDGRRLGRRLWSSRLIDRTLRRRAVVPGELFAMRALTTGCTMAVRRRAVAAALPFPAELSDPVAPMRHDRWLSLVSAAVGTVRALPEPLLGFRVHDAQETGVLVGHELTRALASAGAGVLSGAPGTGMEAHRIRAHQLEIAAERVDDLGDFDSAAMLRRVAGHHLRRARAGSGMKDGIHDVVSGVRAGAYGRDVFGLTSVIADLARALRGARPAGGTS